MATTMYWPYWPMILPMIDLTKMGQKQQSSFLSSQVAWDLKNLQGKNTFLLAIWCSVMGLGAAFACAKLAGSMSTGFGPLKSHI